MSRYPSEGVARFDQRFAESEWERNARLNAKRLSGIHETIADAVPQVARGQVWCKACRSTRKVDGADCLRNGWPICCGYTMTIDSPEDRAGRNGQPPK